MRLFLIFTFSLIGCDSTFSPDPKAVKHEEGACEAAERHLRDLNCPQASMGGGFGAFCNRWAEKSVDYHPDCISRITTCDKFNDASRGC